MLSLKFIKLKASELKSKGDPFERISKIFEPVKLNIAYWSLTFVTAPKFFLEISLNKIFSNS